MSNKGTTPGGNIKVQFPKRRTKTIRVYPGPKTSTPQDRRHQDQTPLVHNYTNNCPHPNKQRGFEVSKEYQKWVLRAKRKALTSFMSIRLRKYTQDKLWSCSKVDRWHWEQWSKRYARSIFCCHSVIQDGNKLKSMYCTQKWCSVCQANRSGKLLNSYRPQLEALPDLYKVNLSIVSMSGDQLGYAIARMNDTWRKIYKAMVRNGMKPQGIRAIEFTHGIKGHHPHYHILISGMDNAMMVQHLWLKHFRFEAGQGGQYVSPCGKNEMGSMIESIVESLKYTVKSSKDGTMYAPDVIHTINEAAFGRQMVIPFGIKKSVQDTNAPQREVSEAGWLKPEKKQYNWKESEDTWTDRYDRDMLSL